MKAIISTSESGGGVFFGSKEEIEAIEEAFYLREKEYSEGWTISLSLEEWK